MRIDMHSRRLLHLIAGIVLVFDRITHIAGHAFMTCPQGNYTIASYTNPCCEIDAKKSLPMLAPSTFTGATQEVLVKNFQDAFAQTEYKTLHAFGIATMKAIESPVSDVCGTTKEDSAPQPLPTKFKFSEMMHPGPCELMCGDEVFFKALDCKLEIKNLEMEITEEIVLLCVGKRLTFTWIALHLNPYQLYINCINIGDPSTPIPEPKPNACDYPTTGSTAPPTKTDPTPGSPPEKPAPAPKNPPEKPAPAPKNPPEKPAPAPKNPPEKPAPAPKNPPEKPAPTPDYPPNEPEPTPPKDPAPTPSPVPPASSPKCKLVR